jgi:hypothetical protein
MTVYIICDDVVTARNSAPAIRLAGRGRHRVGRGDCCQRAIPGQMVAVWNALPGTTSISKFKDRKTAAQRLWTAFTHCRLNQNL